MKDYIPLGYLTSLERGVKSIKSVTIHMGASWFTINESDFIWISYINEF